MRRFEGIIASLQSEKLIADHILRIEKRHNQDWQISNSLVSISNSARLFSEKDLISLSEEQEKTTWEFISAFKRSSKGKKAIQEAQNFSWWKAIA